MDFLFAADNAPFSIALVLMLMIALFEGITTVLGFGISSLLDSLLPDLDLAPGGLDVPEGGLSRFLGWLMVGKVPAIMLFILLLTAFGLLGLSAQTLVHNLTGSLLPGWILSIPVLFASLPVVRFFAAKLAKVMGSESSQVSSLEDLVGCVGVITVGVAKQNYPAQARVKDKFGTQHYVMVQPDLAEQSFAQGESVLLVQYQGQHFSVIAPSSSLMNEMESQ